MNKERLKNRNKVGQTHKYWLRLTRFCNNNCIFCLDKESHDGLFIDFAAITRQLREGRRQGIRKLILSGGEPTLHPDYLKILKAASAMGYKGIQTVSNGRMFAYKKFLQEAVASGLTETTFSMHGHNKKLYEDQSQIKGSFEQALTGLMNALKIKGLIVNIDIVINKINYKYLEDIIRYYINLGVSEFDLLQLVPFGAGWKNRARVFYDPSRNLTYLHRAFALQQEFPWIYLWTNRLPAVYLEGFEELIQHPFKLKDEIRGRRDMLEDYLNNGVMMNCYGVRCRHCFLKDLCHDLIQVKESGSLPGRPYPPCLRVKARAAGVYSWSSFDLDTFVDFFINERYFVKSVRCRACRHNKACAGMQVNYIREHGFKVLKPVK
ncbi:MAG: radical SAM protein [Candidatus Omnitrophica bacterium]|nr:radical SAM protein [Candidatus Omnitrophota bacterium]